VLIEPAGAARHRDISLLDDVGAEPVGGEPATERGLALDPPLLRELVAHRGVHEPAESGQRHGVVGGRAT
jgi:hypothetical protein